MEAVAHNKAFAKKVGIPQSVGQDFAKADKGKTFRKGGDAMATKKKMAVNPAMAMMAARAMRTPAPVQAAPMGGAPMGGMPGAMPGMKKGGKVKKMADGGSDGYLTPAQERTLKMVKTGNYRSEPNEMNYAKPAPSEMNYAKPAPAPQAQKKGGEVKKMAKGGSADPKSMKYDVEAGSNKHGKFGESKVQKSGKTRGMNLGDTGPKEKIESEKSMKSWTKKYAEGGTIKASKMGSVKTSGGHKPHGDGIAERGKTRAMMPKMKGRTI